MPIFIDRHEIEGTSAAEVAEAHARRLASTDDDGVQLLAYWFDEGSGSAFYLLKSPDMTAVHGLAIIAGPRVARRVIPVEAALVEAFRGRLGQAAASGPEHALTAPRRAVMFTDIVGSTEMTVRLGDLIAMELIRTHDGLVRSALCQWAGREVKHLGDGIMASFESSVAAVSCANAVQEHFREYNGRSVEPLHVRIGIACGEPVQDSTDLFGSTVQMASRLCGAAGPDGILVSKEVYTTCHHPHAFIDAGLVALKGFLEPVHAFHCASLSADLAVEAELHVLHASNASDAGTVLTYVPPETDVGECYPTALPVAREPLCPPSGQPVSGRDVRPIVGLTVFDQDGTALGLIGKVLVESRTGEPFVMVTCWSRLHTRRSVCCVALASLSYDTALRGYRSRGSARAFYALPAELGDEGIWPDGHRSDAPAAGWVEPWHLGI